MKLHTRWRTLITLVLAGALLSGALAAHAAAPAGVTIWGYQEGLALAEQDGLYGYANVKGDIVIPIQYTSALDFTLGLAQVRLGSRLGVILQDGTYLIRPEYGTLIHMNSGLYIAQKGMKWGVVSILPFPDGRGGTTNILYDFLYDSAEIVQTGGVDTLVLTQEGAKTRIPLFQINNILVEKQVPSARFPLVRNRLPDFTDVSPRQWYDLWVDLAYNLELMEGVGGNRFAPDATLTVAEAVKLAAFMESRYTGDDFHLQSNTNPVWYAPSVDYCIASGILAQGQFDSYDRPITRAEMAKLFAATSLAKGMPVLNSLDRVRASLPDVPAGSPSADDIYALYAKGVFTGSDSAMTFRPGDSITRAEVAAIVSRMARTEQRVTLWSSAAYYRSGSPATPSPSPAPAQ